MDSNPNGAVAGTAERATKKQVDIDFYESEIAHQRDRLAEAYAHSADEVRRDAANGIAAAVAVFEQDARCMPSRAKRAIELLKHAVFMLDPKAPV